MLVIETPRSLHSDVSVEVCLLLCSKMECPQVEAMQLPAALLLKMAGEIIIMAVT